MANPQEHYFPVIVDTVQVISPAQGQPGTILVLLDEHGVQVTLRLSDTGLRSLVEKLGIQATRH